MELKIYINDNYYKTITVAATKSGGFNAVAVVNQLHDERAQGLLSHLEPIGNMKIRVEPVV
jgi:hypothetical protein